MDHLTTRELAQVVPNSKHLGLGGYPEQNGTERALYPIYFRYITQTDMEPHAGSPEFEQMKSLVGT